MEEAGAFLGRGGGGGGRRGRMPARDQRNGHQGGRSRNGHRRYHPHRPTESEISCFVKYMVFAFNLLFWLLGTVMLLAGVWAAVEKTALSQLAEVKKLHLDPAWLLIIVGGLTVCIGMSGCVGALRENTALLSLYAALLAILLLAQLTLAILAFVFKDGLQGQLERELDAMIVSYRDDPDLQSLIDWIQKDWLECCGIKEPDDWDLNVYFNKSSKALGSPEAGGVPFSCCTDFDAKSSRLSNLYCGHGVRLPGYQGAGKYHRVGCLEKFSVWLNRNVMGVGIALVVIAVLEILGICFAQNLRSDVFAQKARWQYDHRLDR